jgi:murein DD-endopeptidase MepM/ murein hydrolase activator NlpD
VIASRSRLLRGLGAGSLLLAGACAAPARQAFPADTYPPAAHSGGDPDHRPAGTGGPAVAAIQPDGRILYVGESPGLSPIVLRFTGELAALRSSGSDRTPPFRSLVVELDRALATGRPPRLDLLRAAAACEVELDRERAALPAAVVASLEARLSRMEVLIDAPPASGATPWRPGRLLGLPVTPAVVTSFYGPRRDPLDGRPRYHLGLDLEAREGQPVAAAADGQVVSAGWAGGHGNRVEVLHDGGIVTGYSHLSSILVPPGALVRRGQPVGLAGHTGRVTGPHLHFEVWRDGEPQDPLDVLPDTAAVEVRSDAPID